MFLLTHTQDWAHRMPARLRSGIFGLDIELMWHGLTQQQKCFPHLEPGAAANQAPPLTTLTVGLLGWYVDSLGNGRYAPK